jgi:NAD-dependent SIR2 family protein deacetylase
MAAAYPLTDTEFECADQLRQWLSAFDRIFVLTGAGISTASGIPDYRGPDGLWKRSAPITYQAFIREPAMRRRYWMRSFVGWPAVARARPNRAHEALVELESQGAYSTLVTQNVDGLHARAGQRDTHRLARLHRSGDLPGLRRACRADGSAANPG